LVQALECPPRFRPDRPPLRGIGGWKRNPPGPWVNRSRWGVGGGGGPVTTSVDEVSTHPSRPRAGVDAIREMRPPGNELASPPLVGPWPVSTMVPSTISPLASASRSLTMLSATPLINHHFALLGVGCKAATAPDRLRGAAPRLAAPRSRAATSPPRGYAPRMASERAGADQARQASARPPAKDAVNWSQRPEHLVSAGSCGCRPCRAPLAKFKGPFPKTPDRAGGSGLGGAVHRNPGDLFMSHDLFFRKNRYPLFSGSCFLGQSRTNRTGPRGRRRRRACARTRSVPGRDRPRPPLSGLVRNVEPWVVRSASTAPATWNVIVPGAAPIERRQEVRKLETSPSCAGEHHGRE